MRFAVSFGPFAYGVDQLLSGAPDRGVLSMLVALVVWLVTGPLEARVKRYETEASGAGRGASSSASPGRA